MSEYLGGGGRRGGSGGGEEEAGAKAAVDKDIFFLSCELNPKRHTLFSSMPSSLSLIFCISISHITPFPRPVVKKVYEDQRLRISKRNTTISKRNTTTIKYNV